jgi:hypothetical protein
MVSNGLLRSENRGGGGGYMVAERTIICIICTMTEENAKIVLLIRATVVIGRVGGDNAAIGCYVGIHLIYNFRYIRLDVMLLLCCFVLIHVSRVLSVKSQCIQK